MPAAARPQPAQTKALTRCRRRSPSRGTTTTYKPVMNPAFPAVVCTSPICCRFAETNKTRPASPMAIHRWREGVDWIGVVVLRRSRTYTGTKTRPPRVNRRPLNVNGPTNSIPARWATNANPQMTADSSNVNVPVRELLEASMTTQILPSIAWP